MNQTIECTTYAKAEYPEPAVAEADTRAALDRIEDRES